MPRDNGLARLKRRLDRMPADVKAALAPALEKSAQELADTMKHLAPVDQGDLRDSIVVTTGGNATPKYSQPGGSQVVPEGAVIVTAGNNSVRYPHLVEYGTTKTKAQPFFWVSVRLKQKKIKARIKRAISKAVREGAGR